MMWRVLLFATVAIAALVAIGPAFLDYLLTNRWTVRSEITAHFIIDGEEVSGSTIWETENRRSKLIDTPGGTATTYGEAFVLPVDGRNVFVLRRGKKSLANIGFGNFHAACPGSRAPNYVDIRNCSIRNDIRIKPLVIEIHDLSDPLTIEILDYDWADMGGDCAKICLTQIDVKSSDLPSPDRIESILPWLKVPTTDTRYGQLVPGYREKSLYTESDFFKIDFVHPR